MNILVTRPHDDGLVLQQQLHDRGINALLAPVLEISFQAPELPALDQIQAVIVTSRNALKAAKHLNLIPLLSRKPILTVASQTAAFARSLGLNNVQAGPGTAALLAKDIAENRQAGQGPLLFLRGNEVAFNLKSALEQDGFNILERVIYRATPVAAFQADVQQALTRNTVNAVLLMSARSATAFAHLVKLHKLENQAGQMDYFCLSPSVKDSLATALPMITQETIYVPGHPKTEELLALISDFAAN